MKKIQFIVICLFFKTLAVAQTYNVTLSSNSSNVAGEFDFVINQAVNAFNATPGSNVVVNITVNGPINLNGSFPFINLNHAGTFTIKYTGSGPFQGLIVPAVSSSYFWVSGNIANNTKFSMQNIKIVHPVGSQNFVPTINCINMYNVEILNTEILESTQPIVIKENQELSIINCTLSSLGTPSTASGGYTGIHYFDEILNPSRAHVTIQNNMITNFEKCIWLQPLASFIVIDPNVPASNNYANNGTLQNANVNTNIVISGNLIDSWAFGILQDRIPSDRTSPDATYQLTIDNNTVKSEHYCIVLCAPYRHFVLTNNTITLKDDGMQSYWTSSYLTESNLLMGAYQPVTYSHLVLGVPFVFNMGGWRYFANWYKNQFGFDMIAPNNTPPYQTQTGVNHNNVFNVIPHPTNPSPRTPMIQTFGKCINKINLVNMTYPGRVVIFGGETTNIRECKFLPINDLYYPGLTKISPIILETAGFAAAPANQHFFPIPIVGNLGINSPILKKARVKPGFLKVAFDLAGTQIIPQNGPFVIEFFRSDITGALTHFIGKQTISTLTGLTYSVTVPIPTSVILNPGDRIGVTLTSLSTNGNPPTPLPLGTSEVAYIYSEPPCDCISDFAPLPGKEYIASCWTPAQIPCQIKISAYSGLQSSPVLIGSPFIISSTGGPAIDEWTQIEGKLTIPANATILKVELINPYASNDTYVDDIRFFPVDGTVKSYAYDPDNMRLMAELDERNYATFYEYDEEGKLIRVKKETEKGIMTIKESRNNKPTK